VDILRCDRRTVTVTEKRERRGGEGGKGEKGEKGEGDKCGQWGDALRKVHVDSFSFSSKI